MTDQNERDALPISAAVGFTNVPVERQLAQLEGAESALVLASGMSAVACTMVALLRPGDHMLASAWLRAETRRFFETELPALGVTVSFVVPTETRGWRRALQRTTRVLFFESPVDPTTRVVDLRPARTLAEELGIALVVDSTSASPVSFRPLAHGADVVLHDASAYLDGHRDGCAGVVCGTDTVVDEVRAKMHTWGAEPHPAVTESLARGLLTLTARVARQQDTALRVAEWASEHAAIHRVLYLGLPSHPDHAVAQGVLSGSGSLLVLEPRGGESAVAQLLARLMQIRVIPVGTPRRPAGVLSTASAITAGADYPQGAIRLQVGVEDVSLVIADLAQALE